MKLLALVLILSSCGGSMTITEVFDGITQRCVGLMYVSETDSPVEAWKSASTYRGNDPTNFRKAAGIGAVAPLEEVNYADWVDYNVTHHSEWTEMDDYLRTNLTSLRVYKVPETGNPASKTIYAVGMFGSYIIGIKMHAVET